MPLLLQIVFYPIEKSIQVLAESANTRKQKGEERGSKKWNKFAQTVNTPPIFYRFILQRLKRSF